MNTETFKLPEPAEEDRAVVADWLKNHPNAIPIDTLLESGDAPPEVLKLVRARKAYTTRWMSDEFAKDRPLTYRDHASGGGLRLFDGPWLNGALYRVMPDALETTIEDGDDHIRIIWPVWDTYEKAIAADDEEGCRRIAAAIYEYLKCEERTRRTLVLTLQDVGRRHMG